MEDDLLLEEQIKKKKRLVLLLLFTLLLVTAGVAMLLQPASPPSTAIASVETPTPAGRVTPIANRTPSEFQGDEWISPLTPSPKDQLTTPPATPPTATAAENPKTLTGTHPPNTPTATKMINPEGTAASLAATSDSYRETETIPAPPVIPQVVTVVVEVAPTIDFEALVTESSIESKTVTEGSDKTASTDETGPTPTEISQSIVATVVAEVASTIDSETLVTQSSIESKPVIEGSDKTASTAQAAPAATDISKRINESWDVVDEYYTALDNQVNVSKTGTVTKTLTGTTALSETAAAPPPDGLPVTGIITPRRMNWAALVYGNIVDRNRCYSGTLP